MDTNSTPQAPVVGRAPTPPPPPAASAPPPGGPVGPGGPVDPPTTGEEPEARRGRLSRIVGFVTDKGIPLLIALFGLLAAVAGTWGAVATAEADDLGQTNASLERQVDTLSEQNDTLTSEAETLTEDRDQWRDRARDAGTATTTTTAADDDGGGGQPVTDGSSSATDTPAAVLRETGDQPLTFSSGYSIDLDSDAPDWGVNDGSMGDVHFYLGSQTSLSTREVSLVDHVPTEAECDDATVLVPTLPDGQTREGVQMCTRTSEDRFAYVRIVGIDQAAETITLDIIVWE
jgi:cell division protein FtsB